MKIIISFFLSIVIFSTCGPGEPKYNLFIEYTVKNVSSHKVDLDIFYVNFDSSVKDSTIALSPNSNFRNQFVNQVTENAFGLPTDSIYIVFDSVKQIVYRKNDGLDRNLLDINCYDGEKVNEYLYKYQYNITDEDYANALEIK